MENLRAEVEKGSMWTVFGHGLVDPKARRNSDQCDFRSLPKGNQVNIPGPEPASGNTRVLEDAWGGGEESLLFLLTLPLGPKADCLEQGQGARNSAALSQCSQRRPKLVKIRGRADSVRTHNRIRSPRLAASSQWNNAGKGIRQIRSVTLGKGLALGAGWARTAAAQFEWRFFSLEIENHANSQRSSAPQKAACQELRRTRGIRLFN